MDVETEEHAEITRFALKLGRAIRKDCIDCVAYVSSYDHIKTFERYAYAYRSLSPGVQCIILFI